MELILKLNKKMQTISAEQFKQKYGEIVSASFAQTKPTTPTMGEKIITYEKENVKSLLDLYGGGEQGIASKIKEDIQVGAEDIGNNTGNQQK